MHYFKYTLPTIILLAGLSLSATSAYYSILGLTAIFSGGLVGFAIMEISKVFITIFLHNYWDKSLGVLKSWLVASVVVLAIITSMGVFGYLSKASSKNSENVSVNSAKVLFLEENISRENIKLKQNQQQLNYYNDAIGKLITENPTKAQAERRRLQKEIANINVNNKEISNSIDKLSAELLPYKSEVKKHEVEIGPLLYITKLIYGDEYQKYSEKTLTYLILVIVLVFDPLAIAMLIASQKAYEIIREKPMKSNNVSEDVSTETPEVLDLGLERKRNMTNRTSQM